jgi:hypothetical protein
MFAHEFSEVYISIRSDTRRSINNPLSLFQVEGKIDAESISLVLVSSDKVQ